MSLSNNKEMIPNRMVRSSSISTTHSDDEALNHCYYNNHSHSSTLSSLASSSPTPQPTTKTTTSGKRLRQQSRLPNILISLLLVLLLLQLLTITTTSPSFLPLSLQPIVISAHGVTTIMEGYTLCVPCTIPNNGDLHLKGEAMTASAGVDGNTTALYLAQDITAATTTIIIDFTGTTVLNVTLINFKSSDVGSQESLIRVIGGVMQDGCSITIRDSTLVNPIDQYTLLYLFDPAFEIQGNSLILLQNVHLKDLSAFVSRAAIDFVGSSRMSFDNCSLTMSLTTGEEQFRFGTFLKAVQLKQSSALTFTDTTLHMESGSSKSVIGISFEEQVELFDSASFILQSTTATFTVRDGELLLLVYFQDVVATGGSYVIFRRNILNATGGTTFGAQTEHALVVVRNTFHLDDTGSFTVEKNSYTVGPTIGATQSEIIFFEFVSVGVMIVKGSSKVLFTNNTYKLGTATSSAPITSLFEMVKLTVAGGCVVNILNNVAHLSGGGTVEKSIQAMVYWPDTTISPSGYVAIEGNSISFDNSDRLNVVSRGWQTLLYTASQFNVSGSVRISDNSIVFNHDSQSTVDTLWYAGFALYTLQLLGADASLLIERNTVEVVTGDAGDAAGVTVNLVRLIGPMYMNGGTTSTGVCTFRIANNAVNVSEFSTQGNNGDVSLLVVNSLGNITLRSYSTFQMESNTFDSWGVASKVGSTGKARIVFLAIFKADMKTVLDRSSWNLVNNTLNTRSITSFGSVFVQISGFEAAVSLSNYASMDTRSNQLISSGAQTNDAGIQALSIFVVTDTISNTLSNLSVVYNFIVSSGSRTAATGGVNTMFVSVSDDVIMGVRARSISSFNTMRISGTVISATNPAHTCAGFKYNSLISTSEVTWLQMSSNTIEAPTVSNFIMVDIGSMTAGVNLENSVQNNLLLVDVSTSYLLRAITPLGLPPIPLTLVSTCNNSIGGQPCVRHPTTGAYPCIMNVSTIFTVDDCSTRTASHSTSPTLSIPVTPSPPITPTVSLIRTRTRPPTSSVTTVRTPTNIIQPTTVHTTSNNTSTPTVSLTNNSHTTGTTHSLLQSTTSLPSPQSNNSFTASALPLPQDNDSSNSRSSSGITNSYNNSDYVPSFQYTSPYPSHTQSQTRPRTLTLPHTPTNTMPVPSCPSNCSHITYISTTTAAAPSRTGEYCNAANRSILSLSSEDVARAEGVKMWVWLARPPWLRINTTYTSISLLPTPMSTALRSLGVWASFTWMTSGDGVAVVLQGGDGNLLHDTEGTVTLPPSMFDCDTDGHTPQFTIVITGAPPILSGAEQTAVTVVSAVSAMSSADLQTVAAMGLSRCSPSGGNSTPAIRALVPIALNEACDGAVQGALLGIGVTAVCAVGAAVVLRALGRVESMRDAFIRIRVPSVVLAVVTLLQMGLTTCGARLFVDGDHGLGVVGMLVGALLLPLNPLLAYTVASRQCYALTPTSLVPGGSMGQFMVRWFLSVSELDVEVYPPVYAQIVGRWVRPSAVWTCLVPITPVLMLACTLASGTTCRPIFLIASVGYGMVAVVYVVFRPHRQFMANYTQALALGLNAASLAVSSQIAQDPFNAGIGSASRALAMAQTGLSVVRLLHSGLGFLAFRLRREQWLQRSGKGPLFEYIAPCGGHNSSKGDELDGDPNNNNHVPLIAYNTNDHIFQPIANDMDDDGGMIALLSREASTMSSSSGGGDGGVNEDAMVDEILERVAERHAQLTGHNNKNTNNNDDGIAYYDQSGSSSISNYDDDDLSDALLYEGRS